MTGRLRSAAGRLSGETRGLSRDSFALGLGMGVTQVSLLIQISLISRFLGLSALGRYALAVSFVGIVGQFLDVRTDKALITLGAPRLRGERGDLASLIRLGFGIDFLTGLAGFVVTAGLALILGPALFAGETDLILILSVTLLLSFGDDTAKAVLRLLGRFSTIARFALVQAILRVGLLVVALEIRPSLTTVAVVIVLVDLFAAVVLPWLAARAFRASTGGGLRASWRGRASPDRGAVLRLIFDTNLLGYLKILQNRLPLLLLAAFVGDRELGVFRIATAMGAAVAIVTDPAQRAIHPRLARLWSEGATRAIRDLLRQATLIAAAGVGLVTLGVMVFGGPLFRLASGQPITAEGRTVLMITLVAVAVSAAVFWNTHVLISVGRSRGLLRLSVVSALAVHLPLAALLPWRYGAVGTAIAFLAATIVGNAWATIAALRSIEGEPRPLEEVPAEDWRTEP
jgi:O-antigen/teichoic acid export membrane protein